MTAVLKRWTRWIGAALVLALALVGAGAAVSGTGGAEIALANAAGEADAGAVDDNAAGAKAADTIAADESAAAGSTGEKTDEEKTEADTGDATGTEDPDRQALLARWDELVQERQRLRAELRRVERELINVARELWPHEWERARDRIMRRVAEYEERIGEYGEEISSWLPPALVERIAQRTGKTPEEVLELIESGQWRELLRGWPAQEQSGSSSGG